MDRAVVVTGVSTGIGRATALRLGRSGFRLFGTVRRAADAAPIEAALGARFQALVLDVTDAPAVRAAAATVGVALGSQRLAGLVNNAGVAVAGPLELLALDELRRQLEVNLVAPLSVTQAFLPLLGADPAREGAPGRIVMVSSVAGRSAAPFLGPYAASKHGLEGLSESLRRELTPYGIDVVIVGPGMVATPIWDKAERLDVGRAAGTVYEDPVRRMLTWALQEGRKGWPPERIAEVIEHALTSARPAVRYAPVAGRLVNWTIPGLLPRRWLDGLIARGLGLRRMA